MSTCTGLQSILLIGTICAKSPPVCSMDVLCSLSGPANEPHEPMLMSGSIEDVALHFP